MYFQIKSKQRRDSVCIIYEIDITLVNIADSKNPSYTDYTKADLMRNQRKMKEELQLQGALMDICRSKRAVTR